MFGICGSSPSPQPSKSELRSSRPREERGEGEVIYRLLPQPNSSRSGKMKSALRRICRALFRRFAMTEPRIELVDQLFGGVGNHGAGREDRFGAGLIQRVVILWR